jgi:hypothetical protein
MRSKRSSRHHQQQNTNYRPKLKVETYKMECSTVENDLINRHKKYYEYLSNTTNTAVATPTGSITAMNMMRYSSLNYRYHTNKIQNNIQKCAGVIVHLLQSSQQNASQELQQQKQQYFHRNSKQRLNRVSLLSSSNFIWMIRFCFFILFWISIVDQFHNNIYNNIFPFMDIGNYCNQQQQQQKAITKTTHNIVTAFSTTNTNNNNRGTSTSTADTGTELKILQQFSISQFHSKSSISHATGTSTGIDWRNHRMHSPAQSKRVNKTKLHVLTTPESIIEQASTKRLLDDLIDESVRIAARRPIMMQFNPSSGWIWKRWKGTVFSETWDSCVYRMIYAASVYLLCTAISTPPTSPAVIPGLFYFDIKTPLSGFNVLWGQLLSVTTFTLTFFVNQSYSLWRKCSELSRRLQGRLHDINLSLAAHAARRPGVPSVTTTTTSTNIGASTTTGVFPTANSANVLITTTPTLTTAAVSMTTKVSEPGSTSSVTNPIIAAPIFNGELQSSNATTPVVTGSTTNGTAGSSKSVASSSSTSTTSSSSVANTGSTGIGILTSSSSSSTSINGATPATTSTSTTGTGIPSASLYTIEPSTYTSESRQLLELVSRYCRLFNLLTYASFTRSHRPILTPRGMRRLVERGLMTPSEREILITADIPATQRHNAVLLWIIRVFIEGHAAGHFIGHSGFEQQFVDKIHVCRASYGAIGDELQGRMPLAYAHIVQVLVDLVLWMYPFMAFTSGMSGFLCVLGTGLLTLGYQGLVRILDSWICIVVKFVRCFLLFMC